jgi:hypothetical protein
MPHHRRQNNHPPTNHNTRRCGGFILTRNRQSAKTIGARTERLTADYLAATLGDDRIDKRPKTGAKDRGDIAGLRAFTGQRIVIEVKDCQHETCTKCKRITGLKLPEWTNEANTEAGNDDALVGIVVSKRHGRTNPGQWWVHMTVDDLCALLTGQRHGHRAEESIA